MSLFLFIDIPDFITSLVKKGVHHGEKSDFSVMGKFLLNIFLKNKHKRNRKFVPVNVRLFISLAIIEK